MHECTITYPQTNIDTRIVNASCGAVVGKWRDHQRATGSFVMQVGMNTVCGQVWEKSTNGQGTLGNSQPVARSVVVRIDRELAVGPYSCGGDERYSSKDTCVVH